MTTLDTAVLIVPPARYRFHSTRIRSLFQSTFKIIAVAPFDLQSESCPALFNIFPKLRLKKQKRVIVAGKGPVVDGLNAKLI